MAACGTAYVRFAVANPDAFRLMNRPELRAGHDTAVAGAALAAREILTAAVRACQDEGCIPGGDPTPWALLCWTGVHGLAMLAIDGLIELLPGGAAGIDGVTGQVLDAMGRGLTPRPESPPGHSSGAPAR